jgi:hypothetical protein
MCDNASVLDPKPDTDLEKIISDPGQLRIKNEFEIELL